MAPPDQRSPVGAAAVRAAARGDLQALRASIDLKALAEQAGVMLHQRGAGDWWGCCPFHSERSPSFHILRAKGFFHCFGCGASGSAIDFLMRIEQIGFKEAIDRLGGRFGLRIDAEAAARRAQRLAADEAQARAEKAAQAAELWRAAGPIKPGDLADRYLQGRGLAPPWPATLRLGRWVSKAGLGWPALVAGAARWPAREVVAVQVTPLAEPGVKALARPARLTLGTPATAAVRLSAWSAGRPVVLTEGVEDGLAMLQVMPMAAAWAVLGTANAAVVALPEGADVLLALDGDRPGRWAAARASAALSEAGHSLRLLRLPEGQDPLDRLTQPTAG